MSSTLTRLRTGLSEMGPAWLAGAIAAGPATMASLVTAGAAFGYDLLWVVVLSAVFGTLAQYLAMRLGLLTERGIVGVVEDHLGDGWAWLLVGDTVLAAGLAQLVIMLTLASVSAALFPGSVAVWGVLWAVVLAVGLAGGGYRVAEFGAKALVAFVVLAFVASLVVVPPEPGAALAGLVPSLPAGTGGLSAPLVAAGILGGAVHITLVTMHSYTMRSRGWTRDDYDTALVDVVGSMGVAFGLYSLAVFLVVATVLPGQVEGSVGAIAASQALAPLAGEYASRLFLAGLLGAAVSTLGGNTVVPPYLLADKLGWATDLGDRRYRALLAATALLSAGGALLGNGLPFLPLLVLVLAFGLIGTPFALLVVLYLLNDPEAVPEPNGAARNLAGAVLFGVVLVVNGVQLAERVGTASGVVDALVLVFAAAVGLATLVLLVKFLRAATPGFGAVASRGD
jgi:manganese transport protein